VEDSKLISQAIKLLFEGKGYKVHQQDDGSRVLDDVKKNAIDLVILDLMMPKMPGRSVLSPKGGSCDQGRENPCTDSQDRCAHVGMLSCQDVTR
jgi:hypothetical protein